MNIGSVSLLRFYRSLFGACKLTFVADHRPGHRRVRQDLSSQWEEILRTHNQSRRLRFRQYRFQQASGFRRSIHRCEKSGSGSQSWKVAVGGRSGYGGSGHNHNSAHHKKGAGYEISVPAILKRINKRPAINRWPAFCCLRLALK